MNYHKKINAQRELLDMSLEVLSGLTEISVGKLKEIESGADFTPQQLYLISQALGIWLMSEWEK